MPLSLPYFIRMRGFRHNPDCFFFLNNTPTTEIYPLPLHAALPISVLVVVRDAPLDLAPLARGLKGDRLGMQRFVAADDPLHDLGDPPFVVKLLFPPLTLALVL